MTMKIVKAPGAAMARMNDAREPLGEDLARTSRPPASPSSRADPDRDAATLPGKVGELPDVMAVDLDRRPLADRTRRRRAARSRLDRDPVGFEMDLIDDKTRGNERRRLGIPPS